ncbi:MAG: hypothetical protein J1F20_04900 [Muribaculaceae bacterium]|nr:hypothetical protein [Muribaculaceae bacterium]
MICTDLLNEAQNLLISLGYNGDFTMYYHLENPSIVRLYFKISYVSVIYIDGGWDEIKRDMQTFVSYVIAFQNIRKHADKLTCCWIEQNAKEIDWISEDYTKNAIQKYKTEL